MQITLRKGRPEDWEAAWAIQQAAFQDLVTRVWGGWTDEQVQRSAEAWDPAQTTIIESGGSVIGWVQLEQYPDHDWLNLLVVDPSCQGLGVGSQVMSALMAAAEGRDVPLWLSVYRANRARHLYARLGFRELPRDSIRVFMCFPATNDGVPPR